MNTEQALRLIEVERRYQDAKWGTDNPHTHEEWMVIASEEAGEVARAILNLKSSPPTYVTKGALLRELVQHAAVLTAWIEDYLADTPETEIERLIDERVVKIASIMSPR